MRLRSAFQGLALYDCSAHPKQVLISQILAQMSLPWGGLPQLLTTAVTQPLTAIACKLSAQNCGITEILFFVHLLRAPLWTVSSMKAGVLSRSLLSPQNGAWNNAQTQWVLNMGAE